MMVTYTLDPNQKPTEAQLRQVAEASKRPITFDEDCPESTPEMLDSMRKAVAERNRRLARADQA